MLRSSWSAGRTACADCCDAPLVAALSPPRWPRSRSALLHGRREPGCACSRSARRRVGDIADALPPETYPRLDRAAPALALVGQHGDVVDIADLRGRPVLVTFAFAHCETICPVVVRHSLDAQAALRGTGDDVAVLVVTLDPWRDTPSRLPGMASSWGLPGDDAWVLSGDVASVEAALDAWDVPRQRDTTSGEVTHPSLVYIIDRDGTLAYAATGGAEALATLVRRL
jgi:cytochrome oxidase Cu insertion factor (SCO1/SenC/PrrC family)